MFMQLAEFITSLLFLARDTRENKETLFQLRREMDDLTSMVERLSFEVRHISDREKLEREKLVLQFENAFLRLERRLPPGTPPKDRGSTCSTCRNAQSASAPRLHHDARVKRCEFAR